MELRYMLEAGTGNFKVHAKGCKAISRDLKKSDYTVPGEMICESEREAILDLYDDMIPEQFGEDVEYDKLTEEQLSPYTSSVIFHPLCTKDLPGGWDAVAPAPAKTKAEDVRVKRAAKQALGRVFVDAVAAAVKEIQDREEDYVDILAGMSRDEVAKVTAHWMHHVNAGSEDGVRYWPAVLPRPDRSDWR